MDSTIERMAANADAREAALDKLEEFMAHAMHGEARMQAQLEVRKRSVANAAHGWKLTGALHVYHV